MLASFGPAVTSVVLWLSDYGIDIGCIEVRVRRCNSELAVLSARQLLPLPEAEDYLVRRRRKEQEEEETRQQAVDWTWAMYSETLSAGHVAIARELFRRVEQYVLNNGLPWAPVFREWWLGFQRPGQYYVPVMNLRREKPITFAVKFQDDPTNSASRTRTRNSRATGMHPIGSGLGSCQPFSGARRREGVRPLPSVPTRTGTDGTALT